jgi:cell division protein FtsW
MTAVNRYSANSSFGGREGEGWRWEGSDSIMFATVTILVAIGLLFVYSASYPVAISQGRPPYFYLAKQLCFAVLGYILMIGVMFCSQAQLRRLSKVFLFCCIVALILTPLLSHDPVKRWIKIGPITLQASEWTKFALILYSANFLSRNQRNLRENFGVTLHILLLTSFLTSLVFLQPHLSGAFFILVAGILPWLLAGAPWRYILRCFLFVALIGMMLIPFLHRYQLERFVCHFSHTRDPQGAHYQITRAKNAFIRGGFMGVGFCNGREKQLYLPAAHTDFILATIAEEGGLKVVLPIICFYILLATLGFNVARKCSDKFYAILSSSVVVIVMLQAVLNIAVNTGILPTAGIPLPLLSYGGNSLAATLLGLGFVFNASIHANSLNAQSKVTVRDGRANIHHGSRRDRRAHISSNSGR